MGSAANRLVGILREMGTDPGATVRESTHFGTVTRIEDGTAYVQLDGSLDETPVSSYVSARVGERVSVTIRANAARITGNGTSPPTDDETANRAIENAAAAAEAASAAQESADSASESASSAANAAVIAEGKAIVAQQSANDANQAAVAAQSSADAAATAAATADSKATEAGASATRANAHAADALAQLTVVQDVAGTLDWIASHGTYVATADTTVQPSTVYFELQGSDHVPVAEPSGSPAEHGWYVLDVADSQTDYIMAHLAVTSAGLWVLPSGMGQAQTPQHAPGYKLLLASGGTYVYDASGHLVRSDTAQGTVFDAASPQYIGGENAYIVYYDADNDGVPDSIRIGGSKVTIGGQSLSQVLADIDNTLIYDHTYSIANGVATFSAHVWCKGVEVTGDYPDSAFAWSYRQDSAISGTPTVTSLGTGKTKQVTLSQLGLGGHVIGTFTTS